MSGEAVRGRDERMVYRSHIVSVPYERGGRARHTERTRPDQVRPFQSPMSGEAVRGGTARWIHFQVAEVSVPYERGGRARAGFGYEAFPVNCFSPL